MPFILTLTPQYMAREIRKTPPVSFLKTQRYAERNADKLKATANSKRGAGSTRIPSNSQKKAIPRRRPRRCRTGEAVWANVKPGNASTRLTTRTGRRRAMANRVFSLDRLVYSDGRPTRYCVPGRCCAFEHDSAYNPRSSTPKPHSLRCACRCRPSPISDERAAQW